MTARERVDIERGVYTAGNPHVYEPIPSECAYTELDREHSRRLAELARLRGELFDTRAALRQAKRTATAFAVMSGFYLMGGILAVVFALLK